MNQNRIIIGVILAVIIALDFLILMLYHDPVLSIFSIIFTLIGGGFGLVLINVKE